MPKATQSLLLKIIDNLPAVIEWGVTGRVAAGLAGACTLYKRCTPMFGHEHVRQTRAHPKVTRRRPAPMKPTDVDALNERIKEFEQELANGEILHRLKAVASGYGSKPDWSALRRTWCQLK